MRDPPNKTLCALASSRLCVFIKHPLSAYKPVVQRLEVERQICMARVKKAAASALDGIEGEGLERVKAEIWRILTELPDSGGLHLLRLERAVRDESEDLRRLCIALNDKRRALLCLRRREGVPPTNNATERAIGGSEITAIPELLKMLELKGSVVTIDAMGCQKKIAKEIVGQGADYVLAVKKNRRWLREDVSEAFDYGERTAFAHMETDLFETVDKGHGRVERRRCRAARAPSAIGCPPDGGEWVNMRSVAMVESERRANGETTVGRRYFISSLPACAETILRSVRERWAEKSLKIGVAARRKRAGWDLEYLRSVLGTQMK